MRHLFSIGDGETAAAKRASPCLTLLTEQSGHGDAARPSVARSYTSNRGSRSRATTSSTAAGEKPRSAAAASSA
jgi:hypothetical protein